MCCLCAAGKVKGCCGCEFSATAFLLYLHLVRFQYAKFTHAITGGYMLIYLRILLAFTIVNIYILYKLYLNGMIVCSQRVRHKSTMLYYYGFVFMIFTLLRYKWLVSFMRDVFLCPVFRENYYLTYARKIVFIFRDFCLSLPCMWIMMCLASFILLVYNILLDIYCCICIVEEYKVPRHIGVLLLLCILSYIVRIMMIISLSV